MHDKHDILAGGQGQTSADIGNAASAIAWALVLATVAVLWLGIGGYHG